MSPTPFIAIIGMVFLGFLLTWRDLARLDEKLDKIIATQKPDSPKKEVTP